MPIDLGKMLSQHTQSMFEFLTPARRRQPIPQPISGAHPPHPPAKPTSAAEAQYVDRVF